MAMADMNSMDLLSIADENCALFLWATMPLLREALDFIEGQQFTYKTTAFVWVKRTCVTSVLHWGLGRWTRSNAEVCLLATRGRPRRVDAGVHSVVETPVMKHSGKPQEVRDRIIRLMGDLPRIELFARGAQPGWDVWGAEAHLPVLRKRAR